MPDRGDPTTPDEESTSPAVSTGRAPRVAARAFSPDGTRLVSGSADVTVRVWDAQTGDFLVSVSAKGMGASALVPSSNGLRLTMRGAAIHVWQ